jgi:hypothetical protein
MDKIENYKSEVVEYRNKESGFFNFGIDLFEIPKLECT